MDIIIRTPRSATGKESGRIALEKDRITALQPKIAREGRCEIDAAGHKPN
jgi:hypothetical protein